MDHSKKNDRTSLFILGAALIVSMANASDVPRSDQSDRLPILVEQLDGNVSVTTNDAPQRVRIGTALALPTRIVTGADGTIAIRQRETGVSIAPDSEVAIPESAHDGRLVARMIQFRGSAFYDVEKRPAERLRIETPHLVAVVKGTQFNVSVEAQTTTVSLFEGLLEIRSPDDGQVIELSAGEIAIRSATDGTIRVLPMNADQIPDLAALGRPLGAPGDATGFDDRGIRVATERTDVDAISVDAGASLGAATLGTNALGTAASGVDIAAGLDDSTIAAKADLGIAGIDAGLDVSAGLDGGVTVALDAGAGLGVAAVDAGLGVTASLDGGVSAALDAGADLGIADVGAGLDVAADLDSGVAAGFDAGADLGVADIGAGLDAAADLDSGVAAGLDADVDLGIADIDAGLDVAVDLGSPDTSTGLDVAIDLGLGADDTSGSQPDGGLLGPIRVPGLGLL